MVIAITNLKGGVGKTTISVNLAVEFARRGKSVCLLDVDEGQKSALVFAENRGDTPREPYIEILSKTSKQLLTDVPKYKDKYDTVFIDGVPTLEDVQGRIIWASDLVIVPIEPSEFDFRSFEHFLEKYQSLKQDRDNTGRTLKAFLLLNKVSPNLKVTKVIERATEHYSHQIPLMQTRIGYRTAFKESISDGLGVTEYKDPKAKAEIEALTDEIERILADF